MINEVTLQNLAGFVDPSAWAKISIGGAQAARSVIGLCGARCYVQSFEKVPVEEAF
jgi:hypothetical protein